MITLWCSGFSFSAISMVFWPVLPPICYLIGVAVIMLIMLLSMTIVQQKHAALKSLFYSYPKINRGLILISGLLFGLLWMASVGHWYHYWQLPLDKIQQDVILEGQIDYLHHSLDTNSVKLMLTTDKLDHTDLSVRQTVRLTWSNPNRRFYQGQYVRLVARLKPPHSTVNPHSFNYHQWLVSKGVVATGYVVNDAKNMLLDANTSLRFLLQQRLYKMGLSQHKWLEALIFGERSNLDEDDWALMRTTGTAHLFTISGLHIGIILVWTWFACRTVVFVISAMYPIFRHSNSLALTKLLTLGCGLFFVEIADWQLPVVRAYLLAVLGVLMLIRRANTDRLALFCMMCCGCLICFPYAILGQSFYLSIGAVMCLWWLTWRLPTPPASITAKCWYGLKLQFGLFLLMSPIVALHTGQLSIGSVYANIVLVPLFSILVVPLTTCLLIYLLIPALPMSWLPHVTDVVMGVVVEMIALLADWSWDYNVDISLWQVVCVLLISVLLLYPTFVRRRYLLTVTCAVLAANNLFKTDPNEWRLHIFDVGQGNAAAIERNHRIILFDTGAATAYSESHVKRTILPFIDSLTDGVIDTVVISHYDNDHAGGLADLIHAHPDIDVIEPHHDCKQGKSWEWQGLFFRALWPEPKTVSIDNNDSCVIRVTDGKHSVLLPGDIEKQAEWHLVKTTDLASTILVASHHGSKTSSTRAFLDAVDPAYTILSYGKYNHYGMPHQSVTERLVARNYTCLSTANHGYMRFELSDDKIEYYSMRQHIAPKWFYQRKKLPCEPVFDAR